MVGAVLVLLVLSVLQLGLALHVRNTVTDAAAEGAGMRRSAEDRSRAGPSGHGS